jgi:hypothetical protein
MFVHVHVRPLHLAGEVDLSPEGSDGICERMEKVVGADRHLDQLADVHVLHLREADGKQVFSRVTCFHTST